MTRTTKIIITIVIVAVIAIAAYYSFKPESAAEGEREVAPAANAPVLAKTYTDPTNEFSFSYGEDLEARKIATDGFDVIVVEGHGDSIDGFQIVISPFDDGALSSANMSKYLNGAKATDVRELTVGYTGKGFIFKSDNPSFEGGSIEAWFAKGNKLYQATTYARNEQLLLSSLATWKFTK